MTALAFALYFMDQLPTLIQAGASVAHIVSVVSEHKAQQATFAAENRDPTPAEWDAMNARLDGLEKHLQA